MGGGSTRRPAIASDTSDRSATPATPATPDAVAELAVLVVDDEPVIRAYVARALTLAGFDVAVAAGGREALRLVAENRVRPDVVITDIEMPGMTGIELAARLLALRPGLRVVMMTGDPSRAEAARGHPSIVDEVLVKPMGTDQLVNAVRPPRDARPVA